jgi:hypothetical protein
VSEGSKKRKDSNARRGKRVVMGEGKRRNWWSKEIEGKKVLGNIIDAGREEWLEDANIIQPSSGG